MSLLYNYVMSSWQQIIEEVIKWIGILYKETPFGEKESSRKTIFGISDFMFRFWYRYVFSNRTIIVTDAGQGVRFLWTYVFFLVFEYAVIMHILMNLYRGETMTHKHL